MGVVGCGSVTQERGRAAEQRRHVTAGLGLGQGGVLGAGDKDPLHGPVAWIADGKCPLAGGIQPLGAMLLGEAEHALGGAQVVQRTSGEQLVHQLGDVAAGLASTAAAPGRRALQERDLLGRVVGPVGLPVPLGDPQVGLDQLPADKQLDHPGGGACVHLSADIPPGTEYRAPATVTWQSGWTFGVDQAASSNGWVGTGSSAACSVAWKTPSGWAPPSGRHARRPATCRQQISAACTIACRFGKSRPAKKLSRTEGMGRSTRGLSFGLRALAGSISMP